MTTTSTELYALVEAYAALGDHRTGTPVDDATRRWLADELRHRGAEVTEVPYAFRRDATTASLRVGDDVVPTLPLMYSGTGRLSGVTPAVVQVDVVGGVLPVGVDEAVAAQAARGADAAVVVTDAPDGRLVSLNREVVDPPSIPAVLVAGSWADRLEACEVTLDIDARLEDGHSATLVAHAGDLGAPAVVVTTPLTGWFACAGERGTGIAVALSLLARLAPSHHVVFVGTTGHELGHLGLRDWLAHGDLEASCVVHLGASVAAGSPTALSSSRFALTTDASVAGLDDALAPARLPVVRDLPSWPGEGEDWRRLGVPVLSITGGFERFHTPDDVPADVTSPALLAEVDAAVARAVELLVDGAGA